MRGSGGRQERPKPLGNSQVAMVSLEMLVRTSVEIQLDPLTPLEGGPYDPL